MLSEKETEEPNNADDDDTENEYSGKAIAGQAATSQSTRECTFFISFREKAE